MLAAPDLLQVLGQVMVPIIDLLLVRARSLTIMILGTWSHGAMVTMVWPYTITPTPIAPT